MKTNPNAGQQRNGAKPGDRGKFQHTKPKNDRFFKKKFDKPKREGGGVGPPGKQWKPPGSGGNPNTRRGPPGGGGRPQAGSGKPFKHNKPSQGKRQRAEGGQPRGGPANHHQQRQNQQQQRPAQDLDALFTTKPEKVDYCLAPERLEAQSRAIKRFEKQEREAEHQKKQSEKQRKHKMMTMKTKKGQPVMQGRMELLYEKVQKMVGQG